MTEPTEPTQNNTTKNDTTNTEKELTVVVTRSVFLAFVALVCIAMLNTVMQVMELVGVKKTLTGILVVGVTGGVVWLFRWAASKIEMQQPQPLTPEEILRVANNPQYNKPAMNAWLETQPRKLRKAKPQQQCNAYALHLLRNTTTDAPLI